MDSAHSGTITLEELSDALLNTQVSHSIYADAHAHAHVRNSRYIRLLHYITAL